MVFSPVLGAALLLHHVTDYMAFNHHATEFIALFSRCLPLVLA
jgi:hypothetical protein